MSQKGSGAFTVSAIHLQVNAIIPAPAEATGLEVDKLDPESWLSYFRTYMDMYKEAAGGFMGKRGIQYIITE